MFSERNFCFPYFLSRNKICHNLYGYGSFHQQAKKVRKKRKEKNISAIFGLLGILSASDEKAGSVGQWCGSADPDPYQKMLRIPTTASYSRSTKSTLRFQTFMFIVDFNNFKEFHNFLLKASILFPWSKKKPPDLGG